ncbi:radical SAM protein [Microbispora sp. CSR-4]|uniref:radical SAM protein n=1 Tax=Microbispora sp. CSR-4 TaxID=2592813 RepID=UPI0011C9C02E|nr:radical SAM protein [Microbispora sp. CSR-4]
MATTHALPVTAPTTGPAAGIFLALELTGRCQLACTHCYADSSPTGSHGTMTAEDWHRVITQGAALGVRQAQFIGGEPTLHPHFAELLTHTLEAGVSVEVFTNLYRVRDDWWDLFTRPGVSLATSYYSNQAAEHERITGRTDSYNRTRTNIIKAVSLGIPVRAAIVDLLDGQAVEQARAELAALGVTRVRVDHLRGIGRGTQTGPDPSQLCGRCGDNRLAISPSGDVTPCVMSRWMVTGNVRRQPLAEILTGQAWRDARALVPAQAKVCAPECNPASDGGDCAPAQQVDGE